VRSNFFALNIATRVCAPLQLTGSVVPFGVGILATNVVVDTESFMGIP